MKTCPSRRNAGTSVIQPSGQLNLYAVYLARRVSELKLEVAIVLQ